MTYKFIKNTYWVEDLNISCEECLIKNNLADEMMSALLETMNGAEWVNSSNVSYDLSGDMSELIGSYGDAYVPFNDPESDDDGELVCQYCRTLCTKEVA